MDLRNLTKLILKLTGIYLIASALMGAAQLLYLSADSLAWYVAYLASYLVFGSALLWFPGAIINRALRIEGPELEGAVTASRLMGVGVVLLGLYFTATSLFALTYTLAGAKLFFLVNATYGGERGPEMNPDQFASVASAIARLCIGLALWFGWKTIAKLSGGGEHDR